MANRKGTLVLAHDRITLIIERFAHQILEHHPDAKELVLLGIHGHGAEIASRINGYLSQLNPKLDIHSGVIHIDKESPLSAPPESDMEIASLAGKHVILVDDVLNSGKTLVHALRWVLSDDVASVKTIVLVDRIHRSYPVKADFVGMTLSTTLQERVEVEMGADEDYAYLV